MPEGFINLFLLFTLLFISVQAIWLQTHHCFKLLRIYLCTDCCIENSILIKTTDTLKTFKSRLLMEKFSKSLLTSDAQLAAFFFKACC